MSHLRRQCAQNEGWEGETAFRAQVERFWAQKGPMCEPQSREIRSLGQAKRILGHRPAGWSLTTRGHHFSQFSYVAGSSGQELRKKLPSLWWVS